MNHDVRLERLFADGLHDIAPARNEICEDASAE
jgi:hypothetical protein